MSPLIELGRQWGMAQLPLYSILRATMALGSCRWAWTWGWSTTRACGAPQRRATSSGVRWSCACPGTAPWPWGPTPGHQRCAAHRLHVFLQRCAAHRPHGSFGLPWCGVLDSRRAFSIGQTHVKWHGSAWPPLRPAARSMPAVQAASSGHMWATPNLPVCCITLCAPGCCRSSPRRS